MTFSLLAALLLSNVLAQGGRVRGQTMTLTVTLNDPEEDRGTFTLTRGNDARLTKCR